MAVTFAGLVKDVVLQTEIWDGNTVSSSSLRFSSGSSSAYIKE